MPAPAKPPAAAPSTAGTAANGRQPPPQPDWKWTLFQAALVFFIAQSLFGPNGLIAVFRSTPPHLQQQQQQGSTDAGKAVTPGQPAAPQGPHLPLAKSIWEPDQRLDLYIFLTQGPPPTALEIRSQYSQWTHYGLGPHATALTPPIHFAAPAYKPLLAPSSAQTAASSTIVSDFNERQLPAVKIANIAFDQAKLDAKVDLGEFLISDAVRTGNHSIWAEIILCVSGTSPNPADPSFHPLRVHRQRKLLTRLFARKKRRVERNLFDKANNTLSEIVDDAEDDFDEKNPPIGAHWHRNLTLSVVPFAKDQKLTLRQEPPPTLQFIFPVLDPAQAQQAAQIATQDPNMRFLLPVLNVEDADGKEVQQQQQPEAEPAQPGVPTKTAYHYPILYPNDFWLMRGHMNPINHTVKTLPLHINLHAISSWKFKLQASANEGWERAQNGQATGLAGQAGTAEIDMIKSILLETSPWWLILTVVVSLLHSLFEVLAFSSDIGDWRKKQDLSGISIGSILTNVVTQIIILLYLLDSSEETSFMIIAGQGVGAAIEAWKLTKAVKVAVVRTPANATGLFRFLPYQIHILNKRVLSEEEKKTQEYDRLAFKLVGMVAVPLLGGWTIYSALYKEHRGWWSFIIQTLTSFVYFFGFASLVPQLVVNYKLKSTAGFSSKTLIYKILGTVVDDFFAFAIPQPTLHRLACFRDDIVFLIFLYQRWIYGVDPTRKNELGEIVDKEGAKRKELAAAAAAAANGDDKSASDKAETASTTAVQAKGQGAARRR